MLYMKIGNQMTLKSSPLGLFIAAPVIRSTGVHLGEKIVSLILWAIKLFELTMGAHIIWRLKKVLKYLCFWYVADSL